MKQTRERRAETENENPQEKQFKLLSPKGSIEVAIDITNKIKYAVKVKGKTVVGFSALSLTLSNGVLGINPQLSEVERQEMEDTLHPTVREKSAEVTDHYNKLALHFKGNYSVEFRVYEDGVAYRFLTDLKSDRVRVQSEEVQYNFTENDKIYFPEEDGFMTQYERSYKYQHLTDIASSQFCSLPALVDIEEGPKVLITEADLRDYPGLYLNGSESQLLSGIFPGVPLKGEMRTKEDYYITERASYIAETKGTRTYPWRLMVIAEKDGDLIENKMVYKLASPLKIDDPSWIKPGKATWNWWNNENIYDVDFRAGVNMSTYKYYIDFAAKLGLEYLVIDETWYELRDLPNVNPDLDIQELVDYARNRNVGVILWAAWKDLEDRWEAAFEQFSDWGVSGIKLDFMKRDDQWMVNWYWKVAKEAASRKLLVDFHGAYKPTGLRRAYPNVISREAVKGLEQVKGLDEHFHPDWSDDMNSKHDLLIAFIRMAAGPMDYTPGAMVNAQPDNFRAVKGRPMSQGTRCHQLAMYVIYECPLQMLADSPTKYLKQNEEIIRFLSKVPSTWDATKVLDAKVGDYLLLARKKEDQWFVGAMTNKKARTITLDLSFLADGSYTAEIYSDGINANRYAEDYRYSSKNMNSDSEIQIQMAPGGGWACIITSDN